MFVYAALAVSASAASFDFVPSNGIISICEQSLNLYINATGESTQAADIEILYNPSQVQIVDDDLGTAGTQITEGLAFEAYYGNDVNTSIGRIRLTGVSFTGPVTTEELFATINYIFVPGNGSTVNFDIRFDGVGATLDSNIANSNTDGDILTSVTDGQFTFNNPSCAENGGGNNPTPPPIPVTSPASDPTATPFPPEGTPGAPTPSVTTGGGSDTGGTGGSTPTATPGIDLGDIKDQIEDILNGNQDGEDPSSSGGGDGPFPPIVSDKIDEFITNCLEVVPVIEQITQNPTATQAITYTIGIGALLQLVLPYLNILNTPSLLLNILNFLFGKAHKRPWGLIVDSTTLQPVPLVLCKLYLGGTMTLIDQTVSDLEGRYGFPITPGNYRLEVTKNGYEKYIKEIKIAEKERGYVYDINFNQLNLKLSAEPGNQLSKIIKSYLLDLYQKSLPFLFIFGFLLSVVSAFRFGGFLNWLVFTIYVSLITFNILSKIKIKEGYSSIIDSQSMLRVPNVLVKIYDMNGNLVDTKITNNNGYFEFWGEPGEYLIDANRRGYVFPSKNNDLPIVRTDQKSMIQMNLNKGSNNLKLFVDPI